MVIGLMFYDSIILEINKDQLATLTPGFTGAEVKNLVNHAIT